MNRVPYNAFQHRDFSMMYGNNTNASLPLDLVKESVMYAFSLRKLRTSYTGSAIRIRRGSDSVEFDIGFDINGDLDIATLSALCPTASAFVTTWYDQSGNGLNATQSTGSLQPRILISGVLQLQNGLPALYFVNNRFTIATIYKAELNAEPLSVALVSSYNAKTSFQSTVWTHIGISSMTVQYETGVSADSGISLGLGSVSVALSKLRSAVNLFYAQGTSNDATNKYAECFGQAVVKNHNTSNLSSLATSEIIGSSLAGASALNGFIQEFIIYNKILNDKVVISNTVNVNPYIKNESFLWLMKNISNYYGTGFYLQ